MKTVLIARPLHGLLARERSLLDRADLRVLTASTPAEALALHQAHPVDLVILALDPYGMRPTELCRRLREDVARGSVPIIMTCENSPEAIAACRQCAADVVLLEPLEPVLLIAKARQFLDIPERASIRVALTAAVDARTQDGAFTCRTDNVSTSGMLIVTDRRLAEGTRLSCRFYLPVAKLVEAQGRIVRIIERSPAPALCEYGLVFTDISEETRRLLADHVAERQLADRDDASSP